MRGGKPSRIRRRGKYRRCDISRLMRREVLTHYVRTPHTPKSKRQKD